MNSLAFEQFELMDTEMLASNEGGVNWDRVFGGATVYGAATMAVCMATGPIGWGAGAAYLGLCAASGAYIGYGLAS